MNQSSTITHAIYIPDNKNNNNDEDIIEQIPSVGGMVLIVENNLDKNAISELENAGSDAVKPAGDNSIVAEILDENVDKPSLISAATATATVKEEEMNKKRKRENENKTSNISSPSSDSFKNTVAGITIVSNALAETDETDTEEEEEEEDDNKGNKKLIVYKTALSHITKDDDGGDDQDHKVDRGDINSKEDEEDDEGFLDVEEDQKEDSKEKSNEMKNDKKDDNDEDGNSNAQGEDNNEDDMVHYEKDDEDDEENEVTAVQTNNIESSKTEESVTKMINNVNSKGEDESKSNVSKSIDQTKYKSGRANTFYSVSKRLLGLEATLEELFSVKGKGLILIGVSTKGRLDSFRASCGCVRSKRNAYLRMFLMQGYIDICKIRRVTGRIKRIKIPIFSIRDVSAGQRSLDFQRFGRNLDEDTCFSIFHSDLKSSSRTSNMRHISSFDFVCDTHEERDNLVTCLQSIVDGYKIGSFVDLLGSKDLNNRALIHFTLERIKMAADFVQPEASNSISRLGKERARRAAYWLAHFHLADVDGDSSLNADELYVLMLDIGVEGLSRRRVKQLLQKFDTNGDGQLSSEEFLKLAYMIKKRRGLADIFAKLSNTNNPAHFAELEVSNTSLESGSITDGPTIDAETFLKFLHETQKQPELTIDYARKVIREFCGIRVNLANVDEMLFNDLSERMDFSAFCDYIISTTENSVISPMHHGVFQDMTLPLSKYFCNSSHNTYLTDDQLIGSASIEAYVQAYRHGLRCVEVDSWDGPNGPIITHGHTLTESLPLSVFAKVTATEAFKTSPWPLIISLENHCGKDQQKQMASIFQQFFGDMLVPARKLTKTDKIKRQLGLDDTDEDFEHFQRLSKLPSPLELKGKILIKAQVGKNGQVNCLELADLVLLRIEPYTLDVSKTTRGASVDSESAKAGRDLTGWSSMHVRPSDSVLNLAENIVRGSAFDIMECRKFSDDHLVRVYPFGLRFNSSNLNPAIPLSAGCQLVALNTQKSGNAYRLNASVFSINGGVKGGYVLRTDDYYEKDEKPFMMKVTVISAHHLPNISKKSQTRKVLVDMAGTGIVKPIVALTARAKSSDEGMYPIVNNNNNTNNNNDQTISQRVVSVLNPSVEISLTNVTDPVGCTIQSENNLPGSRLSLNCIRTQTIYGNSFDPLWNETFILSTTHSKSTYVTFVVRYSGGQGIAFTGFPIQCIREGYRVLPLWGRNVDPIGTDCHILCYFERVT